MTLNGKTEFQRKAAELSTCVHEIVRSLENHSGKPHQIEYARTLVRLLRPLVAAYDNAVFDTRSREAAAEAVSELNAHVRHAGVSAVKGEMDFDFGSALATYHELHTIFRESQFSSEEL